MTKKGTNEVDKTVETGEAGEEEFDSDSCDTSKRRMLSALTITAAAVGLGASARGQEPESGETSAEVEERAVRQQSIPQMGTAQKVTLQRYHGGLRRSNTRRQVNDVLSGSLADMSELRSLLGSQKVNIIGSTASRLKVGDKEERVEFTIVAGIRG